MKRLAILGASGHGKVIADAALAQGWAEVIFFDDAWPKVFANGRWSVLGGTDNLLQSAGSFDAVVVGIGNNRIRAEKMELLKCHGLEFATIIHPLAAVSSYASLGEGAVVFANAVINVDARIGAGVIINTGAVIEHDCDLGECVHVSPNAVLAGGVTLGNQVWVGAGATLKQLVSVGDGATVGMGCVVLRDVAPGATVVGNPGRVL